ncbi:hypothetical protein SDC9_194538 [bioreactor metagenome]|uniref:Uncharacterized protein n=1 Tax=bioreactor metagenome TaxID=1076179 RepID=A0A645I938_9ZZZZ
MLVVGLVRLLLSQPPFTGVDFRKKGVGITESMMDAGQIKPVCQSECGTV